MWLHVEDWCSVSKCSPGWSSQAQYRERKLKEELQVQLKDEREDFAAKEAVLEADLRTPSTEGPLALGPPKPY